MSDRVRPTQPVRAPSGGPYRQRQQLESSQRAAPLPDNRSSSGAAAPPAEANLPVIPDVYGQTTRPNEPVTAGAGVGPGPNSMGMLPDDPVMFLRAVQMAFPSPGIRRLLERSAR